MESTLIKVYRSGNCVVMQTYSRNLGKSDRFLIDAEALCNWCCDGWRTTFRDSDCGNHMAAYVYRDEICFTFDWLSEYSDGTLRGKRQRVKLPAEDFFAASECEKTVYLLSGNRPETGRVIFTDRAQKEIGAMDRQTRRALSKAMRRGALQYPNTTTTIYADGKNDFFFKTDDGMCGGLVRHEGSRNAVTYGVHT